MTISPIKRKMELLAPGGDVDAIKAAIVAGADAVYCGLGNYNARNRATNIELEDLSRILRLAHKHGCKIFLTLNIVIVESEFKALIRLLNKLVNRGLDGVIVQDLGLFYLLTNHFKSFKIHASTQLTTHNEGQIKFLSKLRAVRVNLSRELNIKEIDALTSIAHKQDISTEVFVHGSNCISFSGICYFSSVLDGKSGNRGRCSQPCRDRYVTTSEGNNFPLNLKDNSAYSYLREIAAAGVDAIKIEGRVKKFHYVYTVVSFWRKKLDTFYRDNRLDSDNRDLCKVFNRDFTHSFLQGDICKDMYIDNPRDNSALHLAEKSIDSTEESIKKYKKEIYDARTEIMTHAQAGIDRLCMGKTPLSLSVSGQSGTLLKVSVTTLDTSFTVFSEVELIPINRKTAHSLDYEKLRDIFEPLNSGEYFIEHLEVKKLPPDQYLPFKELNAIIKKILFVLNGSNEYHPPVDLPPLKRRERERIKPVLSVLISSVEDVSLCKETSAHTFFQLPSCFKKDTSEFISIFLKNRKLIPWFPSVLIGKDYTAAVDILQKVQPDLIVTNNTGIAHEACKRGIAWIAGPHLNIVNSFSLICLKEEFNCCGAFISHELSRNQIKNIVRPESFKLYYSIYHPIVLLTSRQCLIHQVEGCEKERIDEDCIHCCTRSAIITNLKNMPLLIEKSRGDYHCIYHHHNFLNTDIVTDVPDLFSSFCVDLREIKTETEVLIGRSEIVKIFERFLDGDSDAEKELRENIYPSTNSQYKKGI